MEKAGRDVLGAIALYLERPTWVDAAPKTAYERSDVVWSAVGPQDVPILALRDGFVVFEFQRSERYSGGEVPAFALPADRKIPDNVIQAENLRLELTYSRIKYVNAFLCCIYSSYSIVQKLGLSVQESINPENYLLAEKIDDKWKISLSSIKKISYPETRTFITEKNTFENAIINFLDCHRCLGENTNEILSIIYISCDQYRSHQFSSAHLIAWTAIESLLNGKWSNLIDEIDIEMGGFTSINRQRRDLLNGRDFSASVVSQILSICQKIDDETLERANQIRRKRNSFAHNLEKISSDDAVSAIRLATDIISNTINSKFTSQINLSYWY